MMIDIQTQVSRLVAKAGKLIGNSTTNLAECWMHMRTKFDGGKVINRSQSGSFEHRCMGAGLRMNLGPSWGPTTWESITGSQPSNIFSQAAEANSKKVTNDRKRKSTDAEKINRRKESMPKHQTTHLQLVKHTPDMIMESSHRIYQMMFPLITYKD